MRLRGFSVALCMLALLSFGSVRGETQSLMSLLSGDQSSQSELLDAEDAFKVLFDEQNSKVIYTVAEGYYLYKDRLEFLVGDRAISAIKAKGKVKDDPTFGVVETYADTFEVPLDLRGLNAGDTLTLKWQGCAELGVCYPPQQTTVTLRNSHGGDATAAAVPISQPGQSAAPRNEQDEFTSLISGASTWTMILGFFGVGLVLAFTPCVLPMVPILAGIIRGSHSEDGTGPSPFLLSLVYVLSMAVTYTIAGVIVGMTGNNIQAQLQNPWVIWPISILFVVLAAAMFGFFHLGLPSGLTNRLNAISSQQKGGSFVGVGVMGFLSALIVGPCVTPPLIGALVYISQTGNALQGGLALFAMAMGMGVPLLLVGTSLGKFLPKAGGWMVHVNAFFGFVLLGMSLWMLSRLYDDGLMLQLGMGLGAVAMFYLALTLIVEQLSMGKRLLASLALAVAVVMASGGKPIIGPVAESEAAASGIQFEVYTEVSALNAALADATSNQTPVMIDLYADWCVSCKELEHGAFAEPQVVALTNSGTIRAIQLDLTAYNDEHAAYLKALSVFGPPALMFHRAEGGEVESLRSVGVIDGAELLQRLNALQG
ncbi:MAG: protein-disulfide reductase DsbD [Gammaproteobacteria bacterium]|nr:protein-disulfide reductase DsbD [Gammaproteobacteria bacterium]